MIIHLFGFKSELFKIGNVESICPYTIWNIIIKVWNSNAMLVSWMVLDDAGQVTTEVGLKVIEKCLEYLLESLPWTFHERVPESFVNTIRPNSQFIPL